MEPGDEGGGGRKRGKKRGGGGGDVTWVEILSPFACTHTSSFVQPALPLAQDRPR